MQHRPPRKERLYNQLLQECNTTIAHLCRAFYPLNEYLYHDLYNKILLRLWDKIHLLRQESNTPAWVYKLALNTARKHYRRHTASQKKLSIDNLPEKLHPVTLPDDDEQDQYRRMYRLISQLDLDERNLLSLYFDRYSTNQIAECLDISPSDVTTRINRIKNKLILMHKQGKDEPQSELFE